MILDKEIEIFSNCDFNGKNYFSPQLVILPGFTRLLVTLAQSQCPLSSIETKTVSVSFLLSPSYHPLLENIFRRCSLI